MYRLLTRTQAISRLGIFPIQIDMYGKLKRLARNVCISWASDSHACYCLKIQNSIIIMFNRFMSLIYEFWYTDLILPCKELNMCNE